MATTDRKLVEALAETVLQLETEGNIDPNAMEIMFAYYGEDKILGNSTLNEIEGLLGRISRHLKNVFDRTVVLLSEFPYYKGTTGIVRKRERVNELSLEEAGKCTAWRGKSAYGLRLIQDLDNDPIYAAWKLLQARLAGGQEGAFLSTTTESAFKDDLLQENAKYIGRKSGVPTDFPQLVSNEQKKMIDESQEDQET